MSRRPLDAWSKRGIRGFEKKMRIPNALPGELKCHLVSCRCGAVSNVGGFAHRTVRLLCCIALHCIASRGTAGSGRVAQCDSFTDDQPRGLHPRMPPDKEVHFFSTVFFSVDTWRLRAFGDSFCEQQSTDEHLFAPSDNDRAFPTAADEHLVANKLPHSRLGEPRSENEME